MTLGIYAFSTMNKFCNLPTLKGHCFKLWKCILEKLYKGIYKKEILNPKENTKILKYESQMPKYYPVVQNYDSTLVYI